VAFRFARDPKLSTLERFISRGELNRRLTARFEYISQFLDFDFDDVHWHTYLEAGQKTGFYCEDCLSVWRQLASSYGKTIYAPFVTPRLYDTAMSIKPPLRYTDGRITKHLLKKILARRLPGYPVAQRKLSGIIPYQRYARRGPLEHWKEQYPPPDFIDAETVDYMHNNDRAAFWHTIVYSVWAVRIRDLKLRPAPLLNLDIKPPPQ
jgi:asparagine synthase (glutamine-hydrolysing)